MTWKISDRVQSSEDEPVFYCPKHGEKMKVERHVSFSIMTGRKVTTGFLSSCARWFCGESILTGVFPPRPATSPEPQEKR